LGELEGPGVGPWLRKESNRKREYFRFINVECRPGDEDI